MATPDDQRLALELLEARRELATLRLIVTEKFARDVEVVVKPEDAADVAKWAANPGAVRELLKHTPLVNEYDVLVCAACTTGATEHDGETHFADCRIAAAWRALGDPRGQADIERAHEEALREQERRRRDLLPYTARHGGFDPAAFVTRTPLRPAWDMRVLDFRETPMGPRPQRVEATHWDLNGQNITVNGRTVVAGEDLELGDLVEIGADGQARRATYRLAAESQQAAQARVRNLDRPFVPETFDEMAAHFTGIPVRLDATMAPNSYEIEGPSRAPAVRFGARAWLWFQRSTSDARGMEAVEDEARLLNTNVIAKALWGVDPAADPAEDWQRAADSLRRMP